MRKINVVLFSLSVAIVCFAQDIKLKKNEIWIGTQKVGVTDKFNDKETKKKGYVFYDIDGNNGIRFEKQRVGSEYWYVVRPTFITDTVELKHEYLRFTFNEHAALTELLVKKYNFYGSDGMNIDTIKEYILTAEKDAIAKRIEELQKARAFQRELEKTGISIGPNKSILRGHNKELVGFLTFGGELTRDGSTDSYIVIQDEHKNTIAKVRGYKTTSECVISAYDGQEFAYESPVLYTLQNENDYNLYLARFMAYKEYFKGQPFAYATVMGAKIEADQKAREELKLIEKEDFEQRINVTGILYMKDEEIYTGKFQVKFRQTKNGSIGHIKTIDNTDYNAQLLVHSFIDPEKNKEKKKTFNVKHALRFEIDPEYTIDQQQEIYDAVKYTVLREYSNEGGLDLMQFIKLPAVERFAFRIIHTPVIGLNYYDGIYILKKANEEKGIGKKKYVADDLKMIAKDCPEVLKKIEEGYYLDKDSDLVQFVNDYTHAEKVAQ